MQHGTTLKIALLLLAPLAFNGLRVSGQIENPQPDKDGIYAVWSGVSKATLIHAVPAALHDPQWKDSKHICALLVVVGADGKLKKISLANNAASPFDAAAITAVEQSQFEPGTLNGSPVPTRSMVWVPFLGEGHDAVPVIEDSSKKPDALKTLKFPVPKNTPEAEFTDEARRARSGGTVVFQILVAEDGSSHPLRLLSAAGKGLDQNALAAVRTYRFKPATLEDIPVPFLMTVEVHFRM